MRCRSEQTTQRNYWPVPPCGAGSQTVGGGS